VRGILVPAAMALLGERCWYLPGRLSWLPGTLFAETAPEGARFAETAPAGTLVPEG
jgi:RND superfamily putative drug exporter